MLKITVENHVLPSMLKFEGKLAGPWVDLAGHRWDDYAKDQTIERHIVDLAGVSFLDGGGKLLLARMLREGAELKNARLLTKLVLDEIGSELRAS
jgi:hypothetical protein